MTWKQPFHNPPVALRRQPPLTKGGLNRFFHRQSPRARILRGGSFFLVFFLCKVRSVLLYIRIFFCRSKAFVFGISSVYPNSSVKEGGCQLTKPMTAIRNSEPSQSLTANPLSVSLADSTSSSLVSTFIRLFRTSKNSLLVISQTSFLPIVMDPFGQASLYGIIAERRGLVNCFVEIEKISSSRVWFVTKRSFFAVSIFLLSGA